MRTLLICLLLVSSAVSAETEIFRCPLEDGSISFQETPCPEPKDEPTEEPVEDEPAPPAPDDTLSFVNPFDNPEMLQPEPAPEPDLPPPVSDNRAECEKITRDAIDAIDFEIRSRTLTTEEAQALKAEALSLSRQLRACKQL